MDTTERVTVAAGVGTNGAAWSLTWPIDRWNLLSASERVDVIRVQRDLLERGRYERSERISATGGIIWR
jgi:hypothetical protein